MPKPGDLKNGERLIATILFSDMKGFTALSEHMDPEEMDTLMSRVFGAFEEIIRAHGGTVEKYIGDALVAVFGVSELHEDDPARAIHAALDFLARTADLRIELAPRGVELAFRTGIHTGLIATGRRGEHEVVTGHAMSVAQRLESEAATNAILVSEATREKCRDEFAFGAPLELRLKGKSDTVRAWPVKGLSSGEPKDQGPFIGRRDQLDELLRAYLRADPKEPQGFFLLGEAGMGKSRLLQAFVAKVRSFPDYASPVLLVRARSYRSRPYAIIVDLILTRLDLGLDVESEEAKAALAAVDGLDPDSMAAFLELVEGKDVEGFGDSPRARDPRASQALFSILQALLDAHSRNIFPPLLILDDAQSIDPLSAEFLSYWARGAKVKPFLLLAARESPSALKAAFPAFKSLRLSPLGDAEARALVNALWPECPERLIAPILAAGMGNPLFLREYASFAERRRDLSSLPPSVQTIFLSSLERYAESERDLLRKLSVFVHSFSAANVGWIEERSSGDPQAVSETLSRFVADGILVDSGGRYRFRLDVFKKAVYSSLLNHNKRILHGLVADIMQAQERPDAMRLLHHLSRSERFVEAARVILGDSNRNYRYEYLDYLDLIYRRLAREDADLAIRILIVKSAILFNGGKIDEAEAELKRIMRVAINQKDDACMGFAYHQICAYNALSYQFQKALFTGQKALWYYRRSASHQRGIQNVLRYLAFSEMQRNELGEARRLLDQMAAMPGADPFELAAARTEFALASGDYQGALHTIDATLAQGGEPREAQRFFGLDLKLKALWQLCDFEALAPVARELLSSGSLSDSSVSQAHAMLGVSVALSGQADAAAESFRQAEFFADRARNDFDRVDALRTLALCRASSGDRRRAEACAREGLVLGLRHSCYAPTFTLLMILVEARYERQKEEEARFFLREASYLFATGTLLPAKDLILYYRFAALLLAQKDAEANRTIAAGLLEDELARLGSPKRVAAFLASRALIDLSMASESAQDGSA